MDNFRIGYGYDVHALGEGLPLRLGGVDILYEAGFIAHSDGDVLLHAICDALLGAAALGDIGLHFPDTDERFRGADSVVLLTRCGELLRAEGYRICNIDSTVAMQAPKLRPHIAAMRARIAAALGIDVSAVSVKATTTERLGFVGSGDGAEATAVVLVCKS